MKNPLHRFLAPMLFQVPVKPIRDKERALMPGPQLNAINHTPMISARFTLPLLRGRF
jgi:hypothetical protein